MIISKDVVYSDLENILKTDVVKINLETRDINFFMLDKENKIKIINQR